MGCIIIKDRVTGKTYQINTAKPAPDPARNRVIDLIGQTTSAADFCQQGPVLSKISLALYKKAVRRALSCEGGNRTTRNRFTFLTGRRRRDFDMSTRIVHSGSRGHGRKRFYLVTRRRRGAV